MGRVLASQGVRLQLEVTSKVNIKEGFSGAPVWDETEKNIIGMIVSVDERQGIAFAIPAEILKKVWRQGQLIEILNSVNFDFIKSVYQSCRPQWWNPEYNPSDLIQVISDLNTLDERPTRTERHSYLVEFVARLVILLDRQILCQKLRDWVDSSFEIDRQTFAELCDRFREETAIAQQQNRQSRLFLLLRNDGAPDRYNIEAYAIADLEQYDPGNIKTYQMLSVDAVSLSREELASRMPELLADLLDCNPILYQGELQLEIFLPFTALNIAVDCWHLEDDYEESAPIGQTYPVVIRVLDRLGYKKPYRKVREWQQKWRRKKHDCKLCCSEVLVCGNRSKEEIRENGDLDCETVIGLYKTKPPKVGKGGLFSLVMGEGIPVALWLRKDLEDCCDRSREKFEKLLGTPIEQLPQKLKKIRKGTPRDRQTHFGHHLALLWDNPYKVPPDAPLWSNANL